MRLRLALLVAATTSVVLLAFLLPLAVLISRAATNEAINEATRVSQSVASTVSAGSEADIRNAVQVVRTTDYLVAVRLPDGRRLGSASAAAAAPGVPRASTVRRLSSGAALIRQPVALDEGTATVNTLVPEARLHRGVGRAWLVLCLLGLVLVVLSLVVADRLARTLTRPISDLAHTAERLGRGDLAARVRPDGPDEVREVGTALNRLAARIDELLTRERESVADLSHRLRTPITALRLDTETLRDQEERGRILTDIEDLNRQVDALIREARRPVREGVTASSDARAAVADRVEFWRALAEDQGRTVSVVLPDTPLTVRASREDVEAALDALIGNVFAHTPDGTAFGVSMTAGSAGGAVIVVADDGPGLPDLSVIDRGRSQGGSTGLGLDIARSTAAASGGDLLVGSAAGGGAQVTMRLGPPTATGPPLRTAAAGRGRPRRTTGSDR